MRVGALNPVKYFKISEFEQNYAKKFDLVGTVGPVGAPPGEVPILS